MQCRRINACLWRSLLEQNASSVLGITVKVQLELPYRHSNSIDLRITCNFNALGTSVVHVISMFLTLSSVLIPVMSCSVTFVITFWGQAMIGPREHGWHFWLVISCRQTHFQNGTKERVADMKFLGRWWLLAFCTSKTRIREPRTMDGAKRFPAATVIGAMDSSRIHPDAPWIDGRDDTSEYI